MIRVAERRIKRSRLSRCLMNRDLTTELCIFIHMNVYLCSGRMGLPQSAAFCFGAFKDHEGGTAQCDPATGDHARREQSGRAASPVAEARARGDSGDLVAGSACFAALQRAR